MTEHPILFSAPMVRAILAGRKTQTRRVVSSRNSLVNGGAPCMKRDPEIISAWPNLDLSDAFVDPGPSLNGYPDAFLKVAGAEESRHRVYPRIERGDRLWVRETWAGSLTAGFKYRADLSDEQLGQAAQLRKLSPALAGRWTPSIYMKRHASRITLGVTSVRPERLQHISGDDAVAEGIVFWDETGEPRSEFAMLWDSINGKRPGCAWADNPWVWVTSFMLYEVRT